MKDVLRLALLGLLLALETSVWANVLNMGGFRNDDGSWVGLASLETVPVSDAGNAPDYTGYGKVDYEYRIGRYEVTAGQYCEFLNAVAAADTYGLYNTDMTSNSWGCQIKRNGASGNYTYSIAADYANRPVNYVSFGDACRFTNWLHNGQPTGAQDISTTEDGAYYLNGATTSTPLLAVSRKTDWKWAITSEDEWYKAAYYKSDGLDAGYFDYQTSNNTIPSNLLGSPTDPGNNATYLNDVYTIGGPYFRTEVGAHENSESPYKTFDQGGNVWEWNEAIISDSSRGLRGGSFGDDGSYLRGASNRVAYSPIAESNSLGFRVSEVPEPASMVLLVLGSIGMLVKRWGLGR